MFKNTFWLKNSIKSQFKSIRFKSINKNKLKSENNINFRNFISIGIISTIILTQVVDAVNKEKSIPKSMSESEYLKQQSKLKRKQPLINFKDKQVYFLKSNQIIKKENLKINGFILIDPKDLIKMEKNDKNSKFYDLLNDNNLFEPPRGLITELIGKFLKSQPNGKFLIINFPRDLKESTNFEDKIVIIKKFIYVGDVKNDHMILNYYDTVDKVDKINTLNDLKLE